MDVTSLYTVIPNDEGLRALKHFSINARLGNLALKRYELVLTHNFFSFGGNYYKQTSGVAMGTKTALH